MKLVLAIIRNDNYYKTRDALLAAGFGALTVKDVLGRGKHGVERELVKQQPDDEREACLLDIYHMYSKKMLEIYIRDDEEDRLVEVLLNVNSHGHPGDGKIFVLPVSGCTRIRTGEKGNEAIL